jgi:phage terminase large subunit-like protein
MGTFWAVFHRQFEAEANDNDWTSGEKIARVSGHFFFWDKLLTSYIVPTGATSSGLWRAFRETTGWQRPNGLNSESGSC